VPLVIGGGRDQGFRERARAIAGRLAATGGAARAAQLLEDFAA
jgi:hypothetical protein